MSNLTKTIQHSTTNLCLDVKNLTVHFPIGGVFNRKKTIHAVDDISFTINDNEILGLVGESGCGKSTVGRALVGLNQITSGRIIFKGKSIANLSAKQFQPYRTDIQMIFQDPYASFNPRMSIGDTLLEPITIHKLARTKQQANKIVTTILSQMSLPSAFAKRYPHELSGGQRQRVAIAKAMIVNPSLIIADEAVSALDVSVQAQILNLIKDIGETSSISMLFISHDLGVIRYISNRIAVMYLGEIVEIGNNKQIFEQPAHPYTQLLLQSIPRIDARHTQDITLSGEQPSPLNLPSGCRFHSRCPKALDICRTNTPKPTTLADGHSCACHLINHHSAK